eukprot:scaffold15914_cov140-Skeletonema_marinoi.AAC.11
MIVPAAKSTVSSSGACNCGSDPRVPVPVPGPHHCTHWAGTVLLSINDNMRLEIVICLDQEQEAVTAATRARCHVTIHLRLLVRPIPYNMKKEHPDYYHHRGSGQIPHQPISKTQYSLLLPSHYTDSSPQAKSYRGLQSLRMAPSHKSASEIALSRLLGSLHVGSSKRPPPTVFSSKLTSDQFEYNLNCIPTSSAEELRLFEVLPSKSLLTPLILILALIVNSSAAQTVDGTIQRRNKCFADCRQMLKEEAIGTMCAPAVNVHPIPLVFQACTDGERSAFKQACFARCAASTETVPFDKSSSYEACIKHKKGLRLKFVWCRQGYDKNRERLSTVVSSNIVEEESVKELADGEPALNHHHDISRALVHEEVDRTMEKQLQRKDTFQVAGKGKEIIELGSTVPEQETELGLFHSQQTQFGVLSTQEEKHLQHGVGVAVFEVIAHVHSELSLVDVLPRKSLELDKPSLPSSKFAVLLPWADFFFLDKSTSVTSKFDDAKTLECTDFYTSGLSCNYARGIRRRGINLDTILLTPKNMLMFGSMPLHLQHEFVLNVLNGTPLSLPSTKTFLGNILIEPRPKYRKSSNTSHAHVVENDTVSKSLNYEGFELDTTFRRWSLADNLSLESSSITTRSNPDKIDPWQLTFRELLYHVWSAQVPFDEVVERKKIQRFLCRSDLILDSPSQAQGIMSSDGILHQSIHSLRPSRVYLLQDMSSYMLTNVSGRDLLLDKCNMPPRLDAIFVTAVNCGVKSQSKHLCNPANAEVDAWWIQEDAARLELVFSNHISSHKEEIGGIDDISMSFSSCHFELTQYHCTWKALRRKATEECRDDCHAQPRGVYINCIDMTSLELCILRLTPIRTSYDSFATSQVRLRKHPYWAKFKFKECDAPHTSAARPSASKSVLLGNETAKGFEGSAFSSGYEFQSPTDHRQIGFKQHRIDPLTPAAAAAAAAAADAAVSTLQLSFGVSPHVWPMQCRLNSVDPLRIVCLSISSEHVISYQAGGSDNSHLDGDLLQARHPSSTEAITLATLLLVIYCYCCSGATRPLDSVTVDHGIIVESPGEIVIEWKFRRRQVLLCIALTIIDTCWKDTCKIQLATKALRSKLELSGLVSELVPYWNCSVHRGRRLQQPGRLKPP